MAWKGLEPLSSLEVPVLIVGSQDDADTLHPLGVAEEYRRKLPNAELVVEDKGDSPLAWQGARLSNVIADFFERVGYSPERSIGVGPVELRQLRSVGIVGGYS